MGGMPNGLYHEPCMGGPQHRYHPGRLPPPHAAAYQSVGATCSLPPFLLRDLQLNYQRTVHHRNWVGLHDDDALRVGDDAFASVLVDVSQPGAGDYPRALPSCPVTTINTNSDAFRFRLLRQLRPRSHTDPYGDDLVNKNGHSVRHTEVLNAEEQIAVRAYGRASVYREPTDHEYTPPGNRPDLLIMDRRRGPRWSCGG